jgi:hypothetical protein
VNTIIVAKFKASLPRAVATITAKEGINDSVSSLTFSLKEAVPGILTYYKDISMIGKHFLVRHLKNPSIKRHYTLSNSM